MICILHINNSSWGNTRLAMDASGKKVDDHPVEIERFDPNSVPLLKWSDYEHYQQDVDDTQTVTTYQTGYARDKNIRGAPSLSVYSESQYGRNLNRISYVSHGMDNVKRMSAISAAQATPFPSDDEIMAEVRHILSTTDLMKVTKKSVRDQLTRLFGVDLSSKKEFIHICIDGILQGEL